MTEQQMAEAVRRRLGWGRVNVQRWLSLRRQGIVLRVFHNGRDVTDRCRMADDGADIAELYKLNSDGRKYVLCDVAGRPIAMEVVSGISIEPVVELSNRNKEELWD